ncbi:MAG: choice-of-anchor D domain-containing protein [Kofleriaceae bacterium]|nr:choice-of-anchor D domain-containing protein [Kofleriaceae bacterium]
MRWLALACLFVITAVARPAAAAVTSNPSAAVVTDPAGDGTGTTLAVTLTSDAETSVNVTFSGTCSTGLAFPASASLTSPGTGMNATASINVSYNASARGTTAACTITIRQQGNGNPTLGTFTLQGIGVAPVATLTPTSLTFPALRHSTGASTMQMIVVTNTGDTGYDLTLSAATITGTHSGDFTIVTEPTYPTVLAPGTGSATYMIEFNPSAGGARTATLELTTTDPFAATKSAPLSGTGTNAVIGAVNLDFGTVNLSATSIQNARINNTASSNAGPLSITDGTIAEAAGSDWFSFDTANGCTAGMDTCSFTGVTATGNTMATAAFVAVRCHPPAGATGSKSATLTYTSDTDTGATDNVATLSCTAGRADVTVTALAGTNYGDQIINTQSTARGFQLQNTGNIQLTYSLALAGADPTHFLFTGSPCTTSCTLDPGVSRTISIAFRPTTVGSKTATFRVTSNDPDNATVDTTLTGNGTAPHAMASATTLTFGTIEVGDTSAEQTLTLTNTGNGPLSISSAVLTTNQSDYEIPEGDLGAQTVAANNGTTSWKIRCKPTTHGSRNSIFRISSNSDADPSSVLDVTLACNGSRAFIVASPTSLDFMGVPIGNTATRTFTLTNNGNLAATNVTATFSNAGAGYSIMSPTIPIPSIAGNGGQVTVTVRFAPVDIASGGNVTLTMAGAWGTAKTTSAQVSLAGSAQNVDFAVAPGTVDFGSFRWDGQVDRTVCVQNNGTAAFDINSIALSNVMMAGEITIVSIKRNTSAGCAMPSATANVTLPQTLNMGQRLEVIVRANPNDRTGALSAMLTVTSSLSATPMRTVALTGTSTSPLLTNAPGATLDFGSVDIQAGPVTRTLTITNTGDGPMNLGAFTRSPATGGPFSFSPTLPASNQVLQPTQSVTLDVTYTPSAENIDEMLTISHTVAGILGGPSSNMIMIRARGIDRHISLAAAPTFPTTFRNPGSKAPVMPVTVNNTGAAPLKITAVMLTGGPVWELVDGNPVDVPGGGSHQFMVRFKPTEDGAAPAGQLALMNDDNNMPMAFVNLDGVGALRDVTFGDGSAIDLGVTAIGVPVSVVEGLPVLNNDATNEFTIARIELADASSITIDNAPEGEALPASAELRFDVTFTPETEGDFETMAVLYLDEDPVPTTTVPIRGRAVFVDLGGGGGCSTGGGTGGAMVLVLGALLLGRKRKHAGGLVVLVACLVAPTAARAQEASFNLDLSLFDPTPSTTGYRFQVEPATVGKHGDWVAMALASIATSPLVMRQSGTEHLTINRITTMEIGGAYAFLDRFEAGLRLPLYSQNGDGTMLGVPSPNGTARGDLVAHARAQLLNKQLIGGGYFATGASLALTLPTATADQFAGVEKPTARVLGLATFAPSFARKRFTFTGNVGAILRAKAKVANIEQGSGVAWGAGVSLRVHDKLWATGELYGDLLLAARRSSPMAAAENLMVAEWLAGLSFRPDPRIAFGVALGRGLTTGLGAPELRGVFALTYTPGSEKLPPIYPPPPPKIDGDMDADGIKDSKDKCPEDAEDTDKFEDEDGCPDSDNDADTYTDSNDKCPMDKEDVDGFQDDDGCPDLDNDNDGIPDAKDRCPSKAEDKDTYKDDDGCPEPDNDSDGILDDADKCPLQAEVINGNADDDGCPDKGDALIIVTPSALDMMDVITFNGTRLAPASKNIMGQIAATLRAHPEIIRLKIVSHVNPSGDVAKDRELTEKRAIAIREWLIQWGIVPTRLSGQGLGGTKPLVPTTQKGAAQLNDRIELIILEKK